MTGSEFVSGPRLHSEERRFPSRRDILTLGIGAFLVASVPLARRGATRTIVRRRVPAMGTVAEIAVVHEHERFAQGAIEAALLEIRWTEDLLTRFSATSDIGRANVAATGRAVAVDERTADVLEMALALAESSQGRFDPCLGRAVMLWDVDSRTTPPDQASVTRFARRELYRGLEVDRVAGPAVRLHDPDLAIDLGGIGKGWGVDRAVDALRDWGVRDGLVSLGGDLYALGRSPDGDPWRVGVRDPDDPMGVLAELPLSDEALATSGDYEQYFTHDGRRYHHILDAITGEPVETRHRTVTVAHAGCAVADASATAIFGAPLGEEQAVLSQTASKARLVHSAVRPVPDHHTRDSLT